MGADVCTSHSERVAAGYPACCERPGKPAVPTTAERGGEPPPGRPVTAVRAAPLLCGAIRVEPWSMIASSRDCIKQAGWSVFLLEAGAECPAGGYGYDQS